MSDRASEPRPSPRGGIVVEGKVWEGEAEEGFAYEDGVELVLTYDGKELDVGLADADGNQQRMFVSLRIEHILAAIVAGD